MSTSASPNFSGETFLILCLKELTLLVDSKFSGWLFQVLGSHKKSFEFLILCLEKVALIFCKFL